MQRKGKYNYIHDMYIYDMYIYDVLQDTKEQEEDINRFIYSPPTKEHVMNGSCEWKGQIY